MNTRLRLSPTADTNGGGDPAPDPVVDNLENGSGHAPDGTHKGGNEDAKYRRLFEKAEAEKAKVAERLAAYEQAENERKLADMSELERERTARTAAEDKLKGIEHAQMVADIAAKHGLSAEARALMSGADAAALEVSAAALAAIQRQPVQAGTTTMPASTPPPSLDARINAAYKAGRELEVIRLVREQQGLPR